MNKLKYIWLFVLPFFYLLTNVSYSAWTEVPLKTTTTQTSSSTSDTIAGYTLRQIRGFFTADISDRNTMLENVKKAGYYVLWIPYTNNLTDYYTLVFPITENIDFGAEGSSSSDYFYFYIYLENGYSFYRKDGSSSSSGVKMTCTKTGYYNAYSSNSFKYATFENLIAEDPLKFGNIPYLKTLKYNSGYYWNGTDYYYEAPKEEQPDEELTLPSNSEIARAVQNFYDSDYYKNNKDFKDFIVVYNYKTKYFDFIGHNFGNKLGQQIIDAGISMGYPPVSYNERWWKYTLPDEFLTTLFNKYYWLYSTNDFGENIKYEGKGSINDLLDLHFATSSIIVYSTTDYPVNTVLKNENDEMESTVELMPGDQYTYDENLDPTTNEYDPLTNFIPTNPTQNILGDVDFNEINKVFEENKDILNIKNASWLFTANNQLVNYFIGFLSFLIVLIIISRLLGG